MGDPIYGLGYPNNLNKPSMISVVAAVDPTGSLEVLSGEEITGDLTTAYIPRESMQITRTNEDGSAATAVFDVEYPTGSGPVLLPHRYVAMIDPLNPNGLGGFNGIFAGYIIESAPVEAALERTIHVTCTDYNVLGQQPPEPIITQWPPGEGTPVVDAAVASSLTAGSGVTFHPESIRNLYVGKEVYAANSDQSNRERITITAVNTGTGDVTADFSSNKVSTTTTVAGALHATGLQTVTPASMTNIYVGSVVYCKKHHGNQDIGNEWVLVTAVTGTTFTAYFTAWKTHAWEVQSYWAIEGGITDRQLIADGWKQHVDTVDPATGLIVSTLSDIESLIDHCYTAASFSLDKGAVGEYNLSLPHGKWAAPATPADVMNWVVANTDPDAYAVHWYFTFVQPTVPTLIVTLPPQLRYYNADTDTPEASWKSVSHPGRLASDETRFIEYEFPEDGRAFANYQAVVGDNSSFGYWQDSASIFDNSVPNYVGRRIPAKTVIDKNLKTNDECTAKAVGIAHALRLSNRHITPSIKTYAQLDPFILYEPQAVWFDAYFQPDSAGLYTVAEVALTFTEDGLGQYDFKLGLLSRIKQLSTFLPSQYRRGVTLTSASGRVLAAGPASTRYYDTHTMLGPDADIHVGDTSDGDINFYMPEATSHPGLAMTIKCPAGGAGNITVYANTRDGRADSLDGAPTMLVRPGESVTVQSTGEHDRTGLGARWEATGKVPSGDPWLTNGNIASGDTIFGLTSGAGRILLNIGDYAGTGAFNYGEVDPGSYPAMYLYTYLDVRMDTPQNAGQPSDEADTAIFGRSHVHGPIAGSGSPAGIEGDAFVGYDAGHATGGFIAGVVGVAGIDSGKGAEVDLLHGVVSIISHQGTNTLHKAAGLVAKTVAAPSGGGTVEKIYGVWGQAQTQGTLENWSGYFEGNIWSTGEYMPERSAPPTPASDTLAIYAKDKAGVSNLYFKDDAGVEHDLGASGASGITNPYDIQANTMVWERTDHVALMDFHYGNNFRGDLSTLVDVSRGHSHSTTGSNYTTFQSANASLELRDDVSVSADLSGIFIKANVEIMPKTPEHANSLNSNCALVVRTGEDSGTFTGSLFRAYNEDDGIQVFDVYPNGDSVFNTNLAPSSTRGDLYIPSVAGTPTGVPAGRIGTVPIRYDRNAHVLYAYVSGSWVAI